MRTIEGQREILVKPISVEFIDKMGDDKRAANVARVSFAKWDDSEFTEKDAGLLNYLASGLPSAEREDWEKVAKAHTHFSPFCHSFLSVRVKAPMFLARQLVKHQIGLCLSGDTEVTFVKKTGGVSNGTYTRTLKEIAEMWFGKVKYQGGMKGKRNISGSHIRVFDEETERFNESHIVDVIDSGVKQVFEIKDDLGNSVKATADHKFLTDSGWVEVRNLSIGDLLIRHDNGVSFSKTETSRGNSEDVIARREMRKGLVSDKCACCGGVYDKTNLEVDHIVPVNCGGSHLGSNLQLLCSNCHKEKSKREKTKKTTLLPKYVKIVSISKLGEEQCYDITVDKTHNFLGNGFVVHNCWNEESRRYIKDDVTLWLPDVVHKAPDHAKQGASDEAHNLPFYGGQGEDCMDTWFSAKEVIQYYAEEAVRTYYVLIDDGVAPEEARIVLPLNTMTQWVWSGSLLAFNRVYQLRKDSHAQNAAQEFAGLLGKILYQHFPESMKALNYGETI